MAALFNHISKPQKYKIILSRISRSRNTISTTVNPEPVRRPFQGGKGGVGKTSCAASLAVKFATHGHPCIVISTGPAHSLSDSFDQDLTGGMLVPVQGVESPLFALEVNPEKARDELRSSSQKHGGSGGMKNIMDSMGLGMQADQLGDLELEELLDTSPPDLDEAIAISKVMEFVESQEFNKFSRIVFDTAPTGHATTFVIARLLRCINRQDDEAREEDSFSNFGH